METKSFKIDVNDGKVDISLDPNKDGENVLNLSMSLSEAFQEIFSRGVKKEDVKLVDFELDVTKLVLKLDTDRDGEKVIDLKIDLSELVDEIKTAFSKKDDDSKAE
jgi:hypothetical protein